MAEERPRSYLVAASPKAQYEELNISLAAQVADARKNLLDMFEKMEPQPEENQLNLTTIGDDFVKVYLRVRPFTHEEIKMNEDKDCVQVLNSASVRAVAPPESNTYKNAVHLGNGKELHEFGFSRVFSADTTQKQMFDATTADIVKQFIDGQNSLIFSYGVTNAGKTHTIQGSETDPGIIPRALDVLFNFAKDKVLPEPYFQPKLYSDVIKCDENERRKMAQIKETIFRLAELDFVDVETNLTKVSSGSDSSLASSTHSLNDLSETEKIVYDDISCASTSNIADAQYLIYISFAEIYNEYVYDLFEPTPIGKGKRRNVLKLSEDRNGNIYVKGLTEVSVSSTEEALKLLAAGQKNLRFASTKFNYNSSRSHCAYNIRLMRVSNCDGTLSVQKTSKLTFCDLAGSERSAKTERAGERVKESGNINSSLLNLGRCINTLRWNQAHRDNPQIIPFRDSKLTRIFQNFLVGRGKACMIVNISQCASSFDETLHVLKFSAVVKKVKQSSNLSHEPNAPPPTYSLLLRPPPLKGVRDSSVKDKIVPEIVLSRASQVPLPVDEEDDDELSTLDTTIGDNQQIQKYQLVIENLRAQLLEEKRKYLRVEQQIREEVCKEFAKQMSEMEERLTEARREGIEDAEDLADERIELYIQTVKKRQNHERRMTVDPNAAADDEGDGWVPETSLKAAQLQADEKDKEMNELKSQLQSALSKLEESKNVEQGVAASSREDELLTALDKKNKECQDLSEMLAEAGETYKNNTSEIHRLQSYVGVLEESLKKMEEELTKLKQNDENSMVKSRNVQLETRNRELEESCEELRKDKDLASSRYEKELADAKQLWERSQREVDQLKKKVAEDKEPGGVVIAPDTPTSVAAGEDSDGGFKCIELESKIFELEKSLDSLNADKRNQERLVVESNEKVAMLSLDLSRIVEENERLKRNIQEKTTEIERISSESKREVEAIGQELKLKSEQFETMDKDFSRTSDNLKQLEQRLKEAQDNKSTEIEKLKSLESNFESLKKSLESMTHSCFEKATALSKVESEKKILEQKITSQLAEIEKEEKNHLEISNQLRYELDTTKVQLVEAKKSKLEIQDSLTVIENKCTSYKNSVNALEESLKLEKRNNQRIIQDSLNNEKLIENYKRAVHDQEDLQKNIEAALKNRTDELEQLKKDLTNAQNKLSASESGAIVLQKEIARLKNDIELKKGVEGKLRLELNAVQTQLNVTTAENKKLIGKDVEINKLIENCASLSKQKELLTKENTTLTAKNDTLTKDLKTKDNFVNNLNDKIAEKEKTLTALESEICKVEKTHQDVVAGKERQLEAWKQQKEALLVDVDKLKNDVQELHSENTNLKVQLVNKETEVSRLKCELDASKLPPVASAAARRRKPPSVTADEDDANEVELTPMISKKMSQQHRGRASEKESSEPTSTVGRKTSVSESKKTATDVGESSSTRRKMSVTELKKTGDSGGSSPMVAATVGESTAPSVVKVAKRGRPKQQQKRQKTIAVLTEESSPIHFGTDVPSTPFNEALTVELPPESANRPTRKAKSTAINGIFAVSEYWRNNSGNSPNAGSTTDHDNGDEQLPPKKRKRTLYKPPEKAVLQTPPTDAAESSTTVDAKKSKKKR